MPLWKCTHCHHEWEGSKTDVECDWCDELGYMLEEETPFEKLLKIMLSEKGK